MSKELKTIQYTMIKIAEVDTTDYVAVKGAISALYYNINHIYPYKSLDKATAYVGIVYLAESFSRSRPDGSKLSGREFYSLVGMSKSKNDQLKAILEHYDWDYQKIETVIHKNNFYFITDLYNHCFGVITYDESGRRTVEYPNVNNRDLQARNWSKNMPGYLKVLISAIKSYRENIATMPEDMHYYLSKIRRYVTWYMPSITTCDNHEFLEFGYCCRCGELNDSLSVPYSVVPYYSKKHQRDINIALCKGCSLPQAKKGINESYVMLNYIDYSKTLERILDGKHGQRETYTKHFNSIIEY